MDNTSLENLAYDIAIMTEREQAFLEKAWDDSAILPNPDPVRTIVVAVHNGEPHADDVLAVALLKVLSGFNVKVIRTRDPKELEEADLRVDVGEGILDHHGARAVPGVAACSRVFALLHGSYQRPKEVWDNLRPLVEATAAMDSGASTVNVNPWVHAGVMAEMSRPGFGHAGFGPASDLDQDRPDYDALFGRLLDTMVIMVIDMVEWGCQAAKARTSAEKAILDAGNSKVVVFPKEARLADVKRMLWEAKSPCIYYVSPNGPEDYRVLCAADPEAPFAFNNSRRLIPEKFRGLRGSSLADAADLDDAIFCHVAGFIAGFATEKSATKFAKLCAAD